MGCRCSSWKTNKKTGKKFKVNQRTSVALSDGDKCEVCKTEKAQTVVFCPIKRRMLKLCNDCNEQVQMLRAKKAGCWSGSR